MVKRAAKRRTRTKKPKTQRLLIVFFTSPNGRPPWVPVRVEDVPSWVKDDPEVMAMLLSGNEAMKADEGPNGSNFYRAIRAADLRVAARLETN